MKKIKQEVTVSLAAAKEISIVAAGVSVSQYFNDNFALKKTTKKGAEGLSWRKIHICFILDWICKN